METIDIVIRIPKRDYNVFKHGRMPNDAREFTKYMVNAIAKGTVLPEGHGRLVDADAILEDPYGNTYKDIDIAETIIEADKAESEDK